MAALAAASLLISRASSSAIRGCRRFSSAPLANRTLLSCAGGRICSLTPSPSPSLGPSPSLLSGRFCVAAIGKKLYCSSSGGEESGGGGEGKGEASAEAEGEEEEEVREGKQKAEEGREGGEGERGGGEEHLDLEILPVPRHHAIAPVDVPNLFPGVPVLPISRNPLFPRFVKMLEARKFFC